MSLGNKTTSITQPLVSARSKWPMALSVAWLVAQLALAVMAVAPTDTGADPRTDRLYRKLQETIYQYRTIQKDQHLSTVQKKKKLEAVQQKRDLYRADLMQLNEPAAKVDGKIAQWMQSPIANIKQAKKPRPAGKEERQPAYTKLEKSRVDALTKSIATEQTELDKLKDKTGYLARVLKEHIKQHKAELERIRQQALARPQPPPPKAVRLAMGDALHAAMSGKIAHVVDNKINVRAPGSKRPWTVGNWRQRFRDPKVFDTLRRTYYRLQDAMRATLLIKREKWTFDDATKYNGQLSTISARLKATETSFMIELARLSPDSPITKRIIALEKKWLELTAKEREIRLRMNILLKEIHDIEEANGIKPGMVVGNGAVENTIAIKGRNYKHIVYQEFIPTQKQISTIQSKRAKLFAQKTKLVITKASEFLKSNQSNFKIHSELGGPQASRLYAYFLTSAELDTFLRQGRKRYLATKNALGHH